MNIDLAIFTDTIGKKHSAGGYFISPLTKEHHFYGAIDSTEEKAILSILKMIGEESEELGIIQFVTSSTKALNFLCKGKSKLKAPASPLIKEYLRALAKEKGSKYKKNEAPSDTDMIKVSRSDMMNLHIQRKYILDGCTSLTYKDKSTLGGLNKAYKKIPNIFFGPKIFHWEETKSVTLDGNDYNIYYNGNFTPKAAGEGKKDNTVSVYEKLIRSRLYTYYSGKNTRLTDAGQRSLEEIRCIALIKEENPIIEKFFTMQDKSIADLPITPVYVGSLDKIQGGAGSNRLMLDDDHWFSYAKPSGDVIFNGLTRSDISYVFYPQRLGPRIRNEFISLKNKFIKHLSGDLISEEYDITDFMFDYTTNDKGKEICTGKLMLNGKFNFIKIPKMSFDGCNFTLKYVFDIDLPKASVMKALAKVNPRVSLVFENISDTTITYYTIIRTDIGVGIYHSPYGSILVRRKKR